jgi:hypothetical protein
MREALVENAVVFSLTVSAVLGRLANEYFDNDDNPESASEESVAIIAG